MSLDIQPKTSGDVITSADFNAIVSAVNANETAIGGKQDMLVSGTNIKTLNGEGILGSGNLEIQGSDVQSISVDGVDIPPDINGNVNIDLSDKVDKVAGKGLSTNDYTTEEKNKLNGIEAGAQVNDVISVAGKTGAVTLDKNDVGLGNVDNTSDATKVENSLPLLCPHTEIALAPPSTTLTISDAIDHNAINYKIYGNSVQNGTPNPNVPVEIESVGDLVTDTEDEHYGQYKISFEVNSETVDIYLNEPLRKVDNYADYIDFLDGKVHRFVLAYTFNGAAGENWEVYTYQNNSFQFPLVGTTIHHGYCNKYELLASGELGTKDGVWLLQTGSIIVTDHNYSTVEDFKESLQSSPMTTITRRDDGLEVSQETVSLPSILIEKGITTISVDTEISPSKTEIKYYQDINKVIANLQALILN